MTKEEAIKHIEDTVPDGAHICCDIWCEEDIEMQAQDNGYDLTKQEVRDVLGFIHDQHDATIGINWDTISYAIIFMFPEKRKEKK